MSSKEEKALKYKEYQKQYSKSYYKDNQLELNERRRINKKKKAFPFLENEEDVLKWDMCPSLYKSIIKHKDKIDMDLLQKVLKWINE